MDQIKIGKFIQERRKEKGLTQLQLANMLNITDRAVSKWENGRSLPDAGIMIELCHILGISVNELLSGECLEDALTYNSAAEENLLAMHRKDADINKFLIQLEIVILVISLVSFILMMATVSLGVCSFTWQVVLTVAAFLILAGGGYFGSKLEVMAGWYVCPNCETTFVPSLGKFIISPHMGFTRYMKCPKCSYWGWHKKILSK